MKLSFEGQSSWDVFGSIFGHMLRKRRIVIKSVEF